ncbi:MAG: YbjQ family protein [Desulfovibrio sp.]|jgi:uncharacterized protein YbjQ (UPF0145 family)|nr:YbjQ family protein [Desulfovibrio sp.]
MSIKCESCGSKIGGAFGVSLASTEEVQLARAMGYSVKDVVCENCFLPILLKLRECTAKKCKELDLELDTLLLSIEISTFPPTDNAYTYRGLITAHTAIGTGPLIEAFSSITDFWGMESGSYKGKMEEAENSCVKKLLYKAIMMDANRIASTHFSYGELTAGKGMVLVCAQGTAISTCDGPQAIKEKYMDLLKQKQAFNAIWE